MDTPGQLAVIGLERQHDTRHRADGVDAPVRIGGMGRPPRGPHRGAQHALMGSRHAVVRLLAHDDEITFGQVPSLGHPARAQLAAHFFLRRRDQDQRAVQSVPVRRRVKDGGHHRGQRRFVIDAAFAVQAPVFDGGSVGIDGPFFRLVPRDRHRVDMRVQHDHRRALTDGRDGIRRFRLGIGRGRLDLAARAPHGFRDVSRDSLRVTRRVRRGNPDQVAQQVQRRGHNSPSISA